MDENTFWLRFWSRAALLVAFLLSLAVFSCDYRVSKIAGLIESGNDPIAVHCAIEGTGGLASAAICARVGDR